MKNQELTGKTMVDAEMVKESVSEVLNDGNLLTETGVYLDTSDVNMKYEDWFRRYPLGLIISELETGPLKSKADIQNAFVKAMLFDRACSEEWELDFFDIPADERRARLQSDFYKQMFYYKDLRLKVTCVSDFEKDFIYFAEENQMPVESLNEYLNKFKYAVVLELGGSYGGDWECFVVAPESVFIVGYGIWD